MTVELKRIAALLVVVLAVVSVFAQRDFRQPGSRLQRPELYSLSTVLELPYGSSVGEVGLLRAPEVAPVGPQSFAITERGIYILDTANERVEVFDDHGTLQRSYRAGWATDLQVLADGTLVVVDPSA